MLPKPDIHPLVESHLADLRKRGIEPTLAEQIWIVNLCRRVVSPFDSERADLIGAPVRVGGVSLWRLTVGASVWLQDCAFRWWAGDEARLGMAVAWALAFARDREAIRDAAAAGPAGAAAVINAWALGLACTRAELEAAIDEVMPPVPPADPREPAGCDQMDWQAVALDLAVITGIPVDHWVWECSKNETLRAYARAKAALIARVGGGYDPHEADPISVALQDLARAKGIIAEAHKPKEDTPHDQQ